MSRYLERKRQAILAAADQWFLPSGLDAAHLIAAYDFAGPGAESHALQDLSGNGYDLSKSSERISWSHGSGFTLTFPNQGTADGGYLDNAALNQLSIVCAVVKFSGVSQDNRVPLITAGGANGSVQLYARLTCYKEAEEGEESGSVFNCGYPGYLRVFQQNAVYQDSQSVPLTAGVLGANFNSNNGLYINGQLAAVAVRNSIDAGISETPRRTFGGSHNQKSVLNNAKWGTRTISSAVFFDIALSAAYHAAIAAAMP